MATEGHPYNYFVRITQVLLLDLPPPAAAELVVVPGVPEMLPVPVAELVPVPVLEPVPMLAPVLVPVLEYVP